jgi:TusA-related sulfurtransferase
MKADFVIDCLGLYCPMPIIKTSQKIDDIAPGQVVEVVSDDEGIVLDLPNWCQMTGNKFLGVEHQGDEFRAFVQKVAPPA